MAQHLHVSFQFEQYRKMILTSTPKPKNVHSNYFEMVYNSIEKMAKGRGAGDIWPNKTFTVLSILQGEVENG